MAELAKISDLAGIQPLSDAQIESFVRQIHAGVHPRVLARKMHPKNRRLRQRAYYRMTRALLYDDRVGQALQMEVQMELAVGVGPAIRALDRRSARGNIPAIKLLLEATGVHNPRVQHEHSGEIKIKFDIPRPNFNEDEVQDATVVEE